MEVGIILIFVIFAAIVVILGIVSWRQEQQRREALAQLAARLGWRLDTRRDHHHDNEYAQFEIFRRGHGRFAYNTLHGSITLDGRSCAAKMGDFQYKVTSGSGKNRSTTSYRFSYLIIALPWPNVPPLIIREEGFFDRVKGFFGYGAISFESDEFNRMFYVNGDDKKFAYDVIHPRMMELLMATRPPTIDIEHGQLCLTDGRRRWGVEEFQQQLDWVAQFLQHWPAHVKHDLASRVR